ncbi:MAG TPA: hypothetical protein ENK52_06860 [Saprospiraceae bacterium]|nr:hypothetical protein [Saprospiraceae bacterium]
MQKFILFFLMLGMTMIACNSHEAKPLELNKGEKWVANAATTKAINNMLTIVSKPNLSTDEFQEQMNNEFNLIFKNCTMKGEAHRQLHNFLLALKSKINQLDKNSTADKKELTNYLQSYFDYFK